jgi:BirA family biotin operon repressor/biotin-[acetyl-CoA-carboxylase] ligase
MDEPPDSSSPTDAPLDVDMIARALAAAPFPFNLRYFPTIESTNTYAMRLARAELAEGTVVIADHQLAGRGRAGRVWQGFARQQLAFSIILFPPFAAHWLMMASALAVQEAIGALTPLTATIKWPNDVLIGDKKVCGILIETSGDIAIVGIGVNVNGSLAQRNDLSARATTLQDETGHPLSREALASEILTRFAHSYKSMRSRGATGQDEVRAAWRARLSTLGREVRVDQGQTQVTGWAEDVAPDGALMLRLENGARVVITWGDVDVAR